MNPPPARRRSIKVTDHAEQRKAARYCAAYGAGRRPHVLVGSILVTPKRARKLLKRARRELAEGVLLHGTPTLGKTEMLGGKSKDNLVATSARLQAQSADTYTKLASS